MSRRECGSALIEALVIGSTLFVILASAALAAIRTTAHGEEAREAAWTAAVHSARHLDAADAAEIARSLFPDHSVDASRDGDAISVVASAVVVVPHPLGTRSVVVRGSASVPLAPYRSDRG